MTLVGPCPSFSTCTHPNITWYSGETAQGLPDQTDGPNPLEPFQPHWQGKVAFCAMGVISKLESVDLCLFGKHLCSTKILNSK